MEHVARQRRLHRTSRREAVAHRPHRQPAAGVPRRVATTRTRSRSIRAASPRVRRATATRSRSRRSSAPRTRWTATPRTSWRTGASADVRGEELELDFAQPGRHRAHPRHAVAHRLSQPVDHRRSTCASTARTPIPFDLDDSSRSAVGPSALVPAAHVLEGRADHPRRRLRTAVEALASRAVHRLVGSRVQRGRRRTGSTATK